MADAAVAQIPTSFYVIVGSLVIANLGTLVSVFYGIGRLVWFISKLDSRVEFLEKNLSKDVDAAHNAIRDIRARIRPENVV